MQADSYLQTPPSIDGLSAFMVGKVVVRTCFICLDDPKQVSNRLSAISAGDHHVLRSLQENYLSFLSGKDDSGDEERPLSYDVEPFLCELEAFKNQAHEPNKPEIVLQI